MNRVLKGHIFRMYPSIEQQIIIEKSSGVSKYIYNHFLENTYQKYYKEKSDYQN